MNSFEDMRVGIALAIGAVVFLIIFGLRLIKYHRVSNIIKLGKLNDTFIIAKRVSYKERHDVTEKGNEEDYVGDYEYEVDGKTKKYRVFIGFPPATLKMYYYKDKNDAHCENELDTRGMYFSIAVLAGIIAGVVFMFVTR